MADLIFNRPSDNYVFTGSRLRAGTTSTKLNLTSKGSEAVIDLCNNSNIDISASTVFVNGQIVSEGGIQIGSGLYGGKIYKTATNPYEIIIDPFAMDACGNTQDASGQVTIMGDLIVRGSTTTVFSTNVDISDVLLTLAMGSSSALKSNDAGFRVGDDGYASLLYKTGTNRWRTNIGMDISGDLNVLSNLTVTGNLSVTSAVTNSSKITANAGIDFSANILPLNNWSQNPVTWNTFALVKSNLGSALATTANDWEPITNYEISKVVLSNYSFIRMEFKVNFVSSTEADQSLGFRVERNVAEEPTWTTVFTDPSLGSNMGIGFMDVYNGTFIDNLAGVELMSNKTVTYRLLQRRNLNTTIDNAISTAFGVVGGPDVGNYIFLQELYRLDPWSGLM